MHDDFRIAAGAEAVPERGKLAHQRLEIVDLTVEDHTDRPVFVEDRLIATGELDDREPAMTEPDPRAVMKAGTVRTTMAEKVGHPLQQARIGRPAPTAIENPCYPAHL